MYKNTLFWQMKFITLATDYDLKDFYLAKVKARLYKLFPESPILDVYHHINVANPVEKNNLKETAYSFNAMIPEMDANYLNFIFVNVHHDPHFSFLIAKTPNSGYVIAPNNGILGLLDLDYLEFRIIEVPQNSFPELDLIEKVSTNAFESFPIITDPYLSRLVDVKITENELKGDIIYIDGYGNCIVNIKKDVFEAFIANSNYEIEIRRQKILSISKNYADVREGGIAVFFNSQDFMEISFIHDSAKEMLGLKKGLKISVKKS
jgi:S-adenosylmethionine hydrolase